MEINDQNETDQMEAEQILGLLENTMSDPETETTVIPNKRPVSWCSPNSISPAKKKLG